MRGTIKEEDKRNISPLVLMWELKKKEGVNTGTWGEEWKTEERGGGRAAQQNQGELGERGGAFHTKKGSFTYRRRKKKSERKASSRLLDAVSNPISVWSASAARLPGTGSQWRRASTATPLTSNLHRPGQAWEQEAMGRAHNAPQMGQFS